MKKVYTFGFIFLMSSCLFAQEDTTRAKEMDEVVITATRTERKLGNTAVPVQLINNKTIQQSGSQRLTDVLQEQTGIFITSGGGAGGMGGGIFGSGVQLQGLSPDYTLILLDGEPLIGRNGGVIDLSRLAVGNIRKIEIVKGPSSSLYGSEAMGGVINIITEQPDQNRFLAGLRYSRFNNLDASLSGSVHKEKWGLQFFGNTNRSDGYDLDKTTIEKTVDPWNNYTGQLRFYYKPAGNTKISLSARYFDETQHNFFTSTDTATGNPINVSGQARVKDLNVNPVITQRFSNKVKSSLRLYFSRYQLEQQLLSQLDKSTYYYDFFQQDFYRVENQTDIKMGEKHCLIVGGGGIFQRLNTVRYNGIKNNNSGYVFIQDEWKPSERLYIVGGLRYDNNSDYAASWSPKLAAQYKVSNKLSIRASYGGGFKAPDFRQLYLHFTNNVIGYTIYGANDVSLSLLEDQKQQGILTEILPKAYQLALLKPEVSRGINVGFNYAVSTRLNLSANLFRNDIDDLIMVDVVARKSNGSDVYSYFNVNRAFTEGIEINGQYIISKNFQISGGYQFLVTADKDELKKIKAGNEYARDIHTNTVYIMHRSDYAGLPNRSAHMANLKLFYDNADNGWTFSIRGIYRSRWGTTDQDGNGIINRSDEFAKGFVEANISAAKMIKTFRFQVGVDNLLELYRS